jgi:hypothetical protein
LLRLGRILLLPPGVQRVSPPILAAAALPCHAIVTTPLFAGASFPLTTFGAVPLL